MSGIVFVICIPTEKYQEVLLQKPKKKVRIEDKPKFIPYNSASYDDFNSNTTAQKMEKKLQSKFVQQSMQKILQNILTELSITNCTWCKGENDNFFQIIFSLNSSDRCEEILEILKENKIGTRFQSSVSVIPCTIHYEGNLENDSKDLEDVSEDTNEKTTAWNRFVSSVRARLTVAQIVENLNIHAALTFDFLCLILISTILCAIGLVENSNVYLLSSMLISPMMGPVMAATFGSVIQDKRLQKIGVQNELIGLGIATLVGFCYGSLICIITDKYGTQDWPTYEMTSRGELRTLWVGCLIALLSGAAVALGILSANIASLVGVAISTSLMPPAVNAGLLWSLASVYYIKSNETTRYSSLSHAEYYSENRALELLSLGAVSVCLTFVNIICIYAAAVLVFRIKEVAPLASKDQARRRFWRHDIKVARTYNKTFHGEESKSLYRRLSEELSSYQSKKNTDHLHHSTDLSENNSKVDIRRHDHTWSPCMHNFARMDVRDISNYYENLLKERCAKNPCFKPYKRLSQIFSPTTKAEEEKLETISEYSVEQQAKEGSSKEARVSTNFFTGTRKFIVTPCEQDVLNV